MAGFPVRKQPVPPPSLALHGTSTPPTSLESLFASPGGHMVRGALDALLGIGSLAGHGGAYVSSFGGLAPNSVSRKVFEPLGRFSDKAQKGVDQTFDRSNVDVTDSPGYRAIAGRYADKAHGMMSGHGFNLPAQMFAPVVPGAMGMLAYGGAMLHPQKGVTPADQAHAMMDATTHEMSNYEGKHPVLSLGAALAPAGIGAASVGGKIARMGRVGDIDRSIGEINALASMAFKKFDASGMEVKKRVVTGLVRRIAKGLKEEGITGDLTAEFIEKLYPKTAAVLAQIAQFAEAPRGPRSMQSLFKLRTLVTDALKNGRTTKPDKTLLRAIGDHFDGFVKELHPDQLTKPGAFDPKAIKSLQSAQALWTKSAKAQAVADVINKALNDATKTGSGGLQKVLQDRFRKLANNGKAMAQFNPEEKNVIRAVAQGTPISRLLTNIGKFAPGSNAEGIVSMLAGVGGVATGNPVALAVPAAGAMARAASGAMTKKAAGEAMNTILRWHSAIGHITTPNVIGANIPSALWSAANVRGGIPRPEKKPNPEDRQ